MITREKQDEFLAAYAACASKARAAKRCGIDRTTHYKWLASDETYRERFEAATREAAGAIEDEMVRRGKEGVLRPVVYHGQIQYVIKTSVDGKPVLTDEVVAIREYSDRMLELLAKGFMPEKYGSKTTTEVTGPGGGPVQTALTVTFVKPKD